MGLVALLSVFLSSMFLVLASSSVCDLSVQLLSQDPFPAVTGEYVKLVFQINGLENHECGTVSFQLLDKYPLSFDNNSQSTVELNSGIYIRNFPSYAIVAHKVRVDSNALDGENLIETIISKKDSSSELYQFNISVEDTRADFEVYVRDFFCQK